MKGLLNEMLCTKCPIIKQNSISSEKNKNAVSKQKIQEKNVTKNFCCGPCNFHFMLKLCTFRGSVSYLQFKEEENVYRKTEMLKKTRGDRNVPRRTLYNIQLKMG